MARNSDLFSKRLATIQKKSHSRVCIGLDPDPDKLPPHLLAGQSLVEATRQFLLAIIESTSDLACSYKLNFAFFEAMGAEGFALLKDVRLQIPDSCLTIADAKRGDIGNSSKFYARSVFEDLQFDAITASPYMGSDSIVPFLQHEGTCCFVLVRTSNPGSGDLQLRPTDNTLVYQHIAHEAVKWGRDQPGEVGFVVGASDIPALGDLRRKFPQVPFLIPGVGAQGGDPDAVVQASADDGALILVNSSRGILYASHEEDFAAAARQAASNLKETLWT